MNDPVELKKTRPPDDRKLQWEIDEAAAKGLLDSVVTSVRCVEDEAGRRLFVAIDVCRKIGYASPNAQIKRVCSDPAEYHIFKDASGRNARLRVLSHDDVAALAKFKFRRRQKKQKLQCKHCGSQFSAYGRREETAKYCSRECSDESKTAEPNTECTNCGKQFHMKESTKRRYKRTHGYFCSNACVGAHKSVVNQFSGNPNWKGRNVDQDGYRLYVPTAPGVVGAAPFRRMKLHQAVCCEALGIKKIQSGLHVHHRDCDITNNSPSNLALITASDHKWLHKQFGVAPLRAFMRGDASLEQLVSWSDDPARAKILLIQNIELQSAFVKFAKPVNPCAAAVSMKPVSVCFEWIGNEN